MTVTADLDAAVLRAIEAHRAIPPCGLAWHAATANLAQARAAQTWSEDGSHEVARAALPQLEREELVARRALAVAESRATAAEIALVGAVRLAALTPATTDTVTS